MVYHRFVKWHSSQPFFTMLLPSFLWSWSIMANHKFVNSNSINHVLQWSGQSFFDYHHPWSTIGWWNGTSINHVWHAQAKFSLPWSSLVYHRFVKWQPCYLSQPWLTTLWPSFFWPWLTMHWPSFLTKLWQSFNPALPGCLHTVIELRHVPFHKPMVEPWSKESMSTLQPHQNNITWRWIEQDSMAGTVTMESLKLR